MSQPTKSASGRSSPVLQMDTLAAPISGLERRRSSCSDTNHVRRKAKRKVSNLSTAFRPRRQSNASAAFRPRGHSIGEHLAKSSITSTMTARNMPSQFLVAHLPSSRAGSISSSSSEEDDENDDSDDVTMADAASRGSGRGGPPVLITGPEGGDQERGSRERDRHIRQRRDQEAHHQHQNGKPISRKRSNSAARACADEAKVLKRDLRFFFMNPLEKWHARRQYPWKLLIQLAKVILVTSQLALFGEMRVGHISYLQTSRAVFRHLFLEGWTSDRDVVTYPPGSGPLSVYTYNQFYDHITYSVDRYFKLNTSALGSFDYDYKDDKVKNQTPLPKLCILEYKRGDVNPFNSTYVYDTHNKLDCYEIAEDPAFRNNSDTFKQYLTELTNRTLNFDRINLIWLVFSVRTIGLKSLEPFDRPNCFLYSINITFDNSDHNGQVLLSLQADTVFIKRCQGTVLYANKSGVKEALLDLLDVVVLLFAVISVFLCIRALYRAERLKRRTAKFFKEKLDKRLSFDDRLAFLNLFYIIIVLNDICISLGTIFKLSIEFTVFDSGLFTATGVLLGFGNLLTWVGVLRYLSFFSKYNLLILTLKKALPNILRFVLCAFIIYIGFVFCGWAVLGPYHYKFRTIMSSSEALFALVNGDDMFATFDTTPSTSPAVWWFARVYLYSFVALFIYMVLSLFIAIVMDAYEVVKCRYESFFSEEGSELAVFVAECTDSPRSSGVWTRQSESSTVGCGQGCCPIIKRYFSQTTNSIRSRWKKEVPVGCSGGGSGEASSVGYVPFDRNASPPTTPTTPDNPAV